MVLLLVPGDIPGGRPRQHQQGIEDQQAHAGNGQGHHNRNGYGKQCLGQRHGNAPGGGQLGVHCRQGQPVGVQAPEDQNRQQDNGQHPNFTGGDGQHIANQILIVFCEAAAAHGGNQNAQSHSGTGEDANQRIRRLVAVPAEIGEQ